MIRNKAQRSDLVSKEQVCRVRVCATCPVVVIESDMGKCGVIVIN